MSRPPNRPRPAAVAVAGVLIVSAFALLAWLFLAAAKQDPDDVPTASEVAGRIMSPFCPGLTLEECPSQQAGELRDQIARRVASGSTNREIDRWLVDDYGESVLARPPQAISWMVPALFILTGLVAAVVVANGGVGRKHQGRPPEGAPFAGPRTPPGSPLRHELEADLALLAESNE